MRGRISADPKQSNEFIFLLAPTYCISLTAPILVTCFFKQRKKILIRFFQEEIKQSSSGHFDVGMKSAYLNSDPTTGDLNLVSL